MVRTVGLPGLLIEDGIHQIKDALVKILRNINIDLIVEPYSSAAIILFAAIFPVLDSDF